MKCNLARECRSSDICLKGCRVGGVAKGVYTLNISYSYTILHCICSLHYFTPGCFFFLNNTLPSPLPKLSRTAHTFYKIFRIFNMFMMCEVCYSIHTGVVIRFFFLFIKSFYNPEPPPQPFLANNNFPQILYIVLELQKIVVHCILN